jgi:uncharacterized glyoxalase superfamily protein PhnB
LLNFTLFLALSACTNAAYQSNDSAKIAAASATKADADYVAALALVLDVVADTEFDTGWLQNAAEGGKVHRSLWELFWVHVAYISNRAIYATAV